MQDLGRQSVTAADEREHSRAVWVVDDSEAVRLLVTQTFERAGWQVEAFEDLATAHSSLAQQPAPAAVVLDIQLPDGCGLDNVSAFAEAGSAVVVVSNLVGAEQVERAFAEGAVDIVLKPVDMRILLARVERSARWVHLAAGQQAEEQAEELSEHQPERHGPPPLDAVADALL